MAQEIVTPDINRYGRIVAPDSSRFGTVVRVHWSELVNDGLGWVEVYAVSFDDDSFTHYPVEAVSVDWDGQSG